MSLHFSVDELCYSETAIRLCILNIPDPVVLANMSILAAGMEQVRELLGKPIYISSGYRSPELNKAINGAKSSDHLLGYAADFTCPAFGAPLDIVRAIAASDINFGQLIQEGRWVHISFKLTRLRDVLTAHFGATGTTYTLGASNGLA